MLLELSTSIPEPKAAQLAQKVSAQAGQAQPVAILALRVAMVTPVLALPAPLILCNLTLVNLPVFLALSDSTLPRDPCLAALVLPVPRM